MTSNNNRRARELPLEQLRYAPDQPGSQMDRLHPSSLAVHKESSSFDVSEVLSKWPISVLVVDDDIVDWKAIERLFRHSGDGKADVVWASTIAEAERILSERSFDAALIDYQLGGESGLDLISRTGGHQSEVPMVLLTGVQKSCVDIEALECGAVDFLGKENLSLEALERSIRYARVNHAIRKQLLNSEKQTKETYLKVQEANRARDCFFAQISHELRTPLNAILGFSELALYRKSMKPDDQILKNMEYFGHIHKSAKCLLELVDELLDNASAAQGSLSIEPQILDAYEVSQEALDVITPLAEKKGLELVDKREKQEVLLLADSQRLHQIFVNLLSNAVKYTPRGGRVSLNCKEYPDQFEFTIADTGCGIPEDKLEQVLQPFFRLEDPFQPRSQGVGLGLFIVKELIESHKGRLAIKSSKGCGTVVSVFFPKGK